MSNNKIGWPRLTTAIITALGTTLALILWLEMGLHLSRTVFFALIGPMPLLAGFGVYRMYTSLFIKRLNAKSKRPIYTDILSIVVFFAYVPILFFFTPVLLGGATCRGNTNAVEFWLAVKFSPDQVVDDRSLLANAAVCNQSRTAKLLLEKGARPNGEANEKVTPLMAAATYGNEELVRLLLQYHADPTLRSDGLTARSIAVAKNHIKIVSILDHSQKTR